MFEIVQVVQIHSCMFLYIQGTKESYEVAMDDHGNHYDLPNTKPLEELFKQELQKVFQKLEDIESLIRQQPRTPLAVRRREELDITEGPSGVRLQVRYND